VILLPVFNESKTERIADLEGIPIMIEIVHEKPFIDMSQAQLE
jgi:hypothetical protein